MCANHHDDQLGLIGRDHLLHDLRPFDIAAGVVADEPGGRAMLAHDRHLGRLGKGFLETITEPVSHAVTHDDQRCGGGSCIDLALRRRWRTRVVGGRRWILRRWTAEEPTEGIEAPLRWSRLGTTTKRAPELCAR